jgi:DNA polymerase elongation subunit (family B)
MDYVPLKDVILPVIKYKNPILNSVLEEMRQQVVPTRKELIPKGKKAYEKSFVISNTCYSVGVGGIHSLNKPEIYIPDENEYIGHADVTSMYPSFIVQYGWVPRHLGKEFWQIYCKIYYSRIEAKHSGQDVKSTALKLVLNSVTGKMQQETSWLYDPFSVFKIRINGQLVLLMLVDRLLELGCKIVQVNTDGVMYVARKTERIEFRKLSMRLRDLLSLDSKLTAMRRFINTQSTIISESLRVILNLETLN